MPIAGDLVALVVLADLDVLADSAVDVAPSDILRLHRQNDTGQLFSSCPVSFL